MVTPSAPDKVHHSDPPLWSIAAGVIIILIVPLLLYSFAPTGPIREGDTVFSEGEQRVEILRATGGRQGKGDNTCLLDPNSPLIVIHSSSDNAGDSIVAQVQGTSAGEWPFCPLHAEVMIKTHQIFQKPAVFEAVRKVLTGQSGR